MMSDHSPYPTAFCVLGLFLYIKTGNAYYSVERGLMKAEELTGISRNKLADLVTENDHNKKPFASLAGTLKGYKEELYAKV